MGEKEEGEVIDIDALMWAGIKQAASESSWIPKEYYMNDWVSDVERFLRDGGMFQTSVQLISAAPDLLAALKIILEYPYSDASPLDDPLVMERARAAIAKAEGKGE